MEKCRNCILKLVTVVLVGVITFSASLTDLYAASGKKTLWVPLYKQGQTYWCWATSAKMVGDYLYGSRGSISDIVYHVTGERKTSSKGSVSETVEAVNYASVYGNHYICKYGPLGYWKYATSINNGKPYIILFESDFKEGRSGHAIVGRGYKWVENKNSSDYHYIEVNDPWGRTVFVEYASFVGGKDHIWNKANIVYSIVAKGKF